MSAGQSNVVVVVDTPQQLGENLSSLHAALDALVLEGRGVEVRSVGVLLESSELSDLVRHLRYVLDARSAYYRVRGLKRMSPVEVGVSAGRNPADLMVRVMFVGADDQRPVERDHDNSPAAGYPVLAVGVPGVVGLSPDGSKGFGESSHAHEGERIASLSRELQMHLGGTLFVASLSVLFGSLRQVADLAATLARRQINLVSRDGSVDTRTVGDSLFYKNISTVRTFDREFARIIGRRNQAAGAAVGRQSGPKPKMVKSDQRKARMLYEAGRLTVGEIAEIFGVSRGTIYRVVQDERGPRGEGARRSPAVRQAAATVRRVLSD